jgi:hypothetical protein
MKYLKKYKLFENGGSGNASFNWIVDLHNSNYLKLTDILLEIFDDFSINGKTDETFSDESNVEHRFWTYRLEGSSSTDDDTADFSSIGSKKIDSIIVFNISGDIYPQFREQLEGLKDRVSSYVGKLLVIGDEKVDDTPGFVNHDFIIKLENQPNSPN